MDDDDIELIEYLEPGVYTGQHYNDIRNQKTYNLSHEAAVGFMLAALLDRDPKFPTDIFMMKRQNGSEIQIHATSDPNLVENTEILEISNRNYKPLRIKTVTYRPTKRYSAIINYGLTDVFVQFDTLDFVSGFTAYFRDFSDTKYILDSWGEIYERYQPIKLVLELEIPK